ncbi:MAG TPA: hypothetical protein VGJ84_04055 [Polyangiaceae bacterium]|jgi:hypothetical protein
MRAWIFVTLALSTASCATYQQDLSRGQRLYESNEFERALAIWRALESDTDSLTLNDQARYAYLRGMTDYRLRFRADARHWLAVGKAIEQEHPGGLSQEWKTRLEETLGDLNRDVYGGAESMGKGADSGKSAGEPTATAPSTPAAPPAGGGSGTCQSSSDCSPDQVCRDNVCAPK